MQRPTLPAAVRAGGRLCLLFLALQLASHAGLAAGQAGGSGGAGRGGTEWKGERLVAVTDRRLTKRADSPYTDELTLQDLPSAPAGKLRLLLSVMLARNNLDAALNGAIVGCLAQTTGTARADWGTYAADRFTQEVVQIEYYALIAEAAANGFAGAVDTYIRDGGLTACVRGGDNGLSASAQLFAGRAVVAPAAQPAGTDASTPAWAIAVMLGLLAVVALAWIIALALKGEPHYLAHDYEGWEREVVEQLERLESPRPRVQPEVAAVRRMDRQLRSVAGQRGDAVVSIPN